jgi:hypothetical protein
MVKIEQTHVTEEFIHEFHADASTVGLKPGEWPHFLETSLGNGQAFRLVARRGPAGEPYAMKYEQDLGCISLVLWND